MAGNKTNSKKNKHQGGLTFTGERMIPEFNRGKTLYYEHLMRYLMVSNSVKGKKILDVGCGVGYGSWLLSELGAKSVTGFDLSGEAIKYAKKNYKKPNITFSVGNAEKIPQYKEKFDIIVTFELIEHIENHDKFLDGVRKNLSKKGVLFVSTPNKNTYQNENHYHINELTPENFERLLKKEFKYVKLFDQRFVFSNTILPVHTKTDLEFPSLNESYIKEQVSSFMPLNKLADCRYLIAICSNTKISKDNNFSLSTLKVDGFSLEEGVEGLYFAWNKSLGDAKNLKQQLDEITDSKFYKFYQQYNFLKKVFLKR